MKMKKWISTLIVVVVAILSIALWTRGENAVAGNKAAADGKTIEIPRWQYYAYAGSTDGPTEDEMNRLGADGWELVAVETRTRGENTIVAPRYVFKRRRP